jgi:hypothetical protein
MSDDAKITALAKHLGVSEESISNCHGDTYESADAPGEYLVLDDAEADQAWDESLESYIDDCILPECKDAVLAQYFDRDAWKRDAEFDGRGHCLSSYDGTEHEVQVDGDWIFIYRVN